MSTLGDVVGTLRADSPWLLFVAAALLSAAAAASRRVMSSQRRIGERVGQLEQTVSSERTRRRQVEAELLELGIHLPYWPDDPAPARELAVLRGRERRRHLEDEDQDQELPPHTTEATYAPPPVPGAAVARHSR